METVKIHNIEFNKSVKHTKTEFCKIFKSLASKKGANVEDWYYKVYGKKKSKAKKAIEAENKPLSDSE